ncbi:hypothetical protein DL98DRAFT_538168 [Cadophora sp. DSE1049]|nr:hypothetical protein DL98DRAFT_538168 [Cadophora sp. DSE1049]
MTYILFTKDELACHESALLPLMSSIEAPFVTNSGDGSALENAIAEEADTVEENYVGEDMIEEDIVDDDKIEEDALEAEKLEGENLGEDIIDGGKIEEEKVEGDKIEEILSQPEEETSQRLESPGPQPQIAVAEYEDLQHRLTESQTARQDLGLQFFHADQLVAQQQRQLQTLHSDNEVLRQRLEAWVKVDELSQNQINEDANTIQALKNGVSTLRVQLQNANQRFSDYEGMKRHRDRLNTDLINERASSQAASRMHQNHILALNQSIAQANASHAGCDGKIEALEAELKRLRETLDSEQLAHNNNETKARLADAREKEDALALTLKDSQEDLQAAKSQATKFETRARDLKTASDKRKVMVKELRAQLKEKERQLEEMEGNVAEPLSPRPAMEGKKSWRTRNRKFDADKKTRMEEDDKDMSSALVLYGPHRFPEQQVSNVFRANVIEAYLSQMEMDNLVYHDFNRIRFFPNSHGSPHQSASQLTIKATPHSTESATDGKAVPKPQRNTKSRSIEAPKSIKESITESLIFITKFLLYGFGILCFFAYHLPGPTFPHGGPNNAKFVSAAPSCEVFNSAISVVETTCSWEPPKPSALVLVASSTLTAPKPSVADSELFWIDAEDSFGNCSSSDGDTPEQNADDDTCDKPRQNSERRIAIGIAVTVVAPTVVVSAFAYAFGYI